MTEFGLDGARRLADRVARACAWRRSRPRRNAPQSSSRSPTSSRPGATDDRHLLSTDRPPAGPARADRRASCSRWPRRSASTSSTPSARSAATSAPTSAPARSPSRCTRCSTRPRDKILWDVGHQAYPHKILTGRRDQLSTIRKYDGLAPFCSIAESEHDIMGAGHASTAIGYAVGIKEAMRRGHGEGHVRRRRRRRRADRRRRLRGRPPGRRRGHPDRRRAQRQRDVDRAQRRARCRATSTASGSTRKLWHAREGVEGGLTKLPAGIGAAFERLGPHFKESIKAFWAPGLWWEELDFAYMGVIDGHDVRGAAPRAARGAGRRAAGGGALRHRQGQGLRARRGGRPGGDGEVACRQAEVDRQRRPRARSGPSGSAARRQAGPAGLHPGVRRRAGGRVPARRARDRDHGGDELGHRAEHPPARAARPLLRRRHRRAAGGPVRLRSGAAGLQAGRGDLLDLPAARLRPDRPRRLPAEPQRRVRHGPGRPGRRRRARPTTAPSTSPTCAACPTSC